MRSPLLRSLTLAGSLVLGVAVAVLWVRSYWVIDSLSWSSSTDDHLLASGGGRLIYADCNWPNRRVKVGLEYRGAARAEAAWFESPRHTDGFRFIGFEYSREVLPYDTGKVYLSFYLPLWRVIEVPYLAALAITAIHPLMRWRGWRGRKMRRKRGLCVECGYDLRASGARCPECGRAV